MADYFQPPFDFEHCLKLTERKPSGWADAVHAASELSPAQRAACPQCGGANVQVVNVTKRNLAAAFVTEYALDSTAAGVVAGSRTAMFNTCVACGFQWIPRTPLELLTRVFSGQLGGDLRSQLSHGLRRANEDSEREAARRTATIGIGLAALAAILAVAFLTSQRRVARELSRADAWVNCVLAQPTEIAPDCGEVINRRELNQWFENGHMDVLAQPKTRARLEKLAPDSAVRP